jgi:uncharacterized membrane protein YozB (DUF420 family)|tara:strand:- start:247 stop:354 length:108 start_codon:yes stop_codon:yes gene_type:complete
MNIEVEKMWIVPLFTSTTVFLLAGWILIRNKKEKE